MKVYILVIVISLISLYSCKNSGHEMPVFVTVKEYKADSSFTAITMPYTTFLMLYGHNRSGNYIHQPDSLKVVRIEVTEAKKNR